MYDVEYRPQTYFLDCLVDDWGRRWTIWAENWFVDTNSARRNRCERSRKPPKGYIVRLACWYFGFPNFGKCAKNKYKHIWQIFFTWPGLAEMSNGCIVLHKKMCPDPLDLIKCFKIKGLGVGVGGVTLPSLCPAYALRGLLTYIALGPAFGMPFKGCQR